MLDVTYVEINQESRSFQVSRDSISQDFVYAFCHMDGVDLKGEFLTEVNIYLNPALGKCTIEVVCTQCP